MMRENYYFLRPGGIYVSSEPMNIHTVLGSCVSVCLFDKTNGVGGINHFLYHHALSRPRSCRYGDVALPHLLKLVLSLGANPKYLRAHLTGGSGGIIQGSIVGQLNIRLAVDFLEVQKIPISVFDVGGTGYRKVIFHSASGEISIEKGERNA